MITYRNLSEKLEKALNEQLTKEALQAQNYLAYASWAEVNSFTGLAKFLYKHSVEERNHMFKILKYINDRGGKAVIQSIESPGKDPETVGECIERVLNHEIDNTKAINKLVSLSHEEEDWATYNFLHWFVKEQIEEESLIKQLVDRYNLMEKSKKTALDLTAFDEEMEDLGQEVAIPREQVLN